MGQSSGFLILTFAATLLISICVIANRSLTRSRLMARGFYIFAVTVSVATLLYILSGVAGIVPENAEYVHWLRPLLFRGWLVVGVGLTSALLILLNLAPGLSWAVGHVATRSFIT